MNDLERERALRRLAEIATRNPRLMAHLETDDMTEKPVKRPPPPPPPRRPDPAEVAVRIGEEIAARADALIEPLRDDPRLRQHGFASRASVVKLAASLGLEQLEGEVAEGEHLRTAGPEVLARHLAPYVVAVLAEVEQANERLDGLGYVEPRPGQRPPWVALAHGGSELATGSTPLEAAEAALAHWR